LNTRDVKAAKAASGIETHPTVVAVQAAAAKLTKAVEAEIFPPESKHWLSAVQI
jgi:hypothetical protein